MAAGALVSTHHLEGHFHVTFALFQFQCMADSMAVVGQPVGNENPSNDRNSRNYMSNYLPWLSDPLFEFSRLPH